MMVVKWNDGKSPEAVVWGYKFTGPKTGADMITDITKADDRFYLLSYTDPNHPDYGVAVGGIGFDPDTPPDTLELMREDEGLQKPDKWGFFTPIPFDTTDANGDSIKSSYDFDKWTCPDCGELVRWQSGWYNGNWWYYVDSASTWGLSDDGASFRNLTDGSRDLWSYANESYIWPNGPSFPTTLTPILPPK
jgi:hypothetical protein